MAYRVTITCDECERPHRLERTVTEPGHIWIICHDCELPIRATLAIRAGEPVSETAAATGNRHDQPAADLFPTW